MREAPAVFKYNGKYYLLTSGATGWSPNENMFSVADDIFGPWSPLKNPFVRTSPSDPDPAKAFGSQTTNVIPVDPTRQVHLYGRQLERRQFFGERRREIHLAADRIRPGDGHLD
ncbi:hypothetical protein HMSSN036_14060 [Paenibacillus macerans]|nr:hypothetical protein HMSSN036_14060 [Paenibacillus macerans]